MALLIPFLTYPCVSGGPTKAFSLTEVWVHPPKTFFPKHACCATLTTLKNTASIVAKKGIQKDLAKLNLVLASLVHSTFPTGTHQRVDPDLLQQLKLL